MKHRTQRMPSTGVVCPLRRVNLPHFFLPKVKVSATRKHSSRINNDRDNILDNDIGISIVPPHRNKRSVPSRTTESRTSVVADAISKGEERKPRIETFALGGSRNNRCVAMATEVISCVLQVLQIFPLFLCCGCGGTGRALRYSS